GDVSLPQDLERAVAKTLEAFGGLDILVWNSGGPKPGPGTDVDPEGLDEAYELMLAPAVRLVRLPLPQLAESAGGRIIAITSLAAKEPTRHLALSNTFRPALTGWLKTLADELGPQGITVNCVAPGRIATARLEQLYPGGPTEETLAEIPLRRWGDPSELATSRGRRSSSTAGCNERSFDSARRYAAQAARRARAPRLRGRARALRHPVEQLSAPSRHRAPGRAARHRRRRASGEGDRRGLLRRRRRAPRERARVALPVDLLRL